MAGLISILLPVYNGAKYLESALDSLFAQTDQNFEIIACDDGSTDDSLSILQNYAGRFPQLKVHINEKNLGLFGNYNQCLQLAAGEFIKPFAQDDKLSPHYLAKARRALDEHPQVSLVLTAKSILDGQGGETRAPSLNRECIFPGKFLITWSLILLDNRLGEPVVGMFRAKDKGYGYDTRYFHFGDLEYWFRILEKGDLYFINEPLCSFRLHEGGTTTVNHRHLRDLLDCFKLGVQYYCYLEEIGESLDHYFKRLIEFSSLQVDHLVREQGLSLQAVRLTAPEAIPSGRPELSDDYAQMLFLALRYISPTIAELDHLKRCREKDHINFQNEIDKIHRSLSWKVTAPLRAIRKLK
ncbi:MAG: putative glycosyltransferase EpsE [bacterium ADurb.Bin425]|nr:MAG: putative glycosyltransferase EpsE [bacterium ADurb.Bin425]